VTATDQNNCQGSVSFNLVINCPVITVTPATVPAGTAGVLYADVSFTQSGGVGTIGWSLGGALPTGMSFAAGVLGGTPLDTGTFPLTVTATDGNICLGSVSFDLVVGCPTITPTPATLPAGVVGSNYSQSFGQTGGIGAVSYTLSGPLPAYLGFAGGTLSGVPAQAGTYPVTVTATDANGCQGSRSYDLVIAPASTTTTLQSAPNPSAFGQPVTFNAIVDGGPGHLTGTVTFLEGATVLGSGAVNHFGVATLVTAGLAVGPHDITAAYGGDANSLPSTSATLRQEVENPVPVITALEPDAVDAGTPAFTLTVTGTGYFPYSVVCWDGAAQPTHYLDATRLTIPVTAEQVQVPGTHEITVRNPVPGGGLSAPAIFTVRCLPPQIVTQPLGGMVDGGARVDLAVTASGSEPFTCEWFKGPRGDTSQPLTGATGSTLTTPPVLAETSYWVRVSNSCGQADSEATVLVPVFVRYAAHVADTTDWWTRLTLVNPGETSTPVTLEVFDSAGQLRATRNPDPLGPQGAALLAIDSQILGQELGGDLWVRITSQLPLAGLAEFGTRDGTVLTGVPLAESPAEELTFPYVYSTPSEGGSYYTGLTLVNPGHGPAAALLTAVAEDGRVLATSAQIVPPLGKYVRLVGEIFPEVADPVAIRRVEVASDRPLVGFELFGRWDERGVAGLPAVDAAGYAVKDFLPGDLFYTAIPANDAWYTGLTVSNFSGRTAQVLMSLYDGQGQTLAETEWVLAPREQATREVWGFFGGTVYPGAAMVRMKSAERIGGFELVLSRSGPFRFDGLAAASRTYKSLLFPLVQTGAAYTTRIRLSRIFRTANPVTLVAYDAAGGERGRYSLVLDGTATVSVDPAAVFPGAVGAIAWIRATAADILVGDATIESTDRQKLVSYPGVGGY